jgi:integral membrane protein
MQLKLLWYAAIAETISWVGLITGMVLKYGFDQEMLVSIFGRVHGGLFLLYVIAAFVCFTQYKWPIQRLLLVVAAAVPPFAGYFVVHGLIRDAQKEQSSAAFAQ